MDNKGAKRHCGPARPKRHRENNEKCDRTMKATLPTRPKLDWTAEERARIQEGLKLIVEWTRSQGLTEEEIAEIARNAVRRRREAEDCRH